MTIQAAGVCLILLIMFIALVKELLPSEICVFLALAAFMLFGILSPENALSGFSNPGVHTVASLLIVGAAVSKSGLLHRVIEKILSETQTISLMILKIMLPTGIISAFINNTPLVTILLPSVQNWAIMNKIQPSKLLIPLSYAAILGGTITLIGTSSNMLVQSLLIENGHQGFDLFDFAYIGIPLTITGILYFTFFGHRLLPARKPNIEKVQEEQDLYIHHYRVKDHSALIGKTIKEAMLRNLKHIFLIEIYRGDQRIEAGNDNIIQAEDILVFSGNPQGILNAESYLGLEKCSGLEVSIAGVQGAFLIEVSIPEGSSLINRRIKEIHFRSKYNAVILAIKRKGTEITSGFGNLYVKENDTLVLMAGTQFLKNWGNSNVFRLHSSFNNEMKKQSRHSLLICILLLLFCFAIFQVLPIYNIALLATILLILSRSITITDAFQAINWRLIILMGSSIGIGNAVEATGLAKILSQLLLSFAGFSGILGILIFYYLVTMLLTEILNNLATAAVMFPIGYSISEELLLDPLMFAMVTAIASSCSFLTPIGYQTNMIVMGPGGYRFSDFFKAGLPLSLLCMTAAILVISIRWI
ncbi:SLC13 family permease [Cytobacillus firmus]|uniref:SLC13 family permease n=1 Tax=Cytobacillus firmus TaxID=1399 RepID=UPI00207AA7E7|nr:SLC13 family permease [Cytobacillus firmus]USK41235.1 SLC13 family permease [Cytobacillus firmus]